jgi:PAS domain S-box-containing protein
VDEFDPAFEAIPDALIALANDGVIESCNSAASTLIKRVTFSGAGEDAQTIGIFEHNALDINGEALTTVPSPIARILHGERISGPDAPIIRLPLHDGKELYLQISGTPHYDDGHTITHALLILRDVTDMYEQRRNLEETLLQRLLEQRMQRENQQRSDYIRALTSQIVSDYAYVYRLSDNGQIQYEWVSDSLQQVTGYTLDDLETLEWNQLQLYHPEDLPEVTARMAATYSGVPDSREWRIITRSGEVRWLHDSCYTERDQPGGIIRVYGVAEDITERKQTELHVQQLTQQLNVIFASIADGIIVYDANAQVIQINDATHTLYGLEERPDFFSLPVHERIAMLQMCDEEGNLLTAETSPMARILSGEVLQDTRTVDVHITSLNGRQLELNISGAPSLSTDGQQIGGVLIMRDVTARRHQQRRTQRALETLLQIAATLVQFPDPLEPSDASALSTRQETAKQVLALTCTLLNSSLASIIIIDQQSHTLQPIATNGFSSEQHQALAARLAHLPFIQAFDATYLSRLLGGDALLLPLDQPFSEITACYAIAHPFVAPLLIGDHCLGMIVVDVDNVEEEAVNIYSREELLAILKAVGKLAALVIERERLVHARTEAQTYTLAQSEISRQKDAFLHLASHELRTPLAILKASIQITRRRLRRLKETTDEAQFEDIVQQVEEVLQRGEQQLKAESRLVNSLLDVSQVQDHGIDLQLELFDLRDAIQETVHEFTTVECAHPISIVTENDSAVLVVADRDRIVQVLESFLSNAAKFSPAPSPITVRILAGSKHMPSLVRVEIQDYGQELAAEERTKIWERFYQAPNRKIYSGSTGLGLGLYLSQAIIRQHHGQVGVQSQSGQGATFWFMLPLA